MEFITWSLIGLIAAAALLWYGYRGRDARPAATEVALFAIAGVAIGIVIAVVDRSVETAVAIGFAASIFASALIATGVSYRRSC